MKLEIVFKDGRKEIIDSVESFNVTEEHPMKREFNAFEIVDIPTEGKLFEVSPLEIDRRIFEKPIVDVMQEKTRKIILEAFDKVDKYPERYGNTFYTLIPEKTWKGYKTVKELKLYANALGGVMADWVEQALEWAQRISNGESWDWICNYGDTAKWYRMIAWRDDYYRIVGGSINEYCNQSASYVSNNNYYSCGKFDRTVPLIVLKKSDTVICF